MQESDMISSRSENKIVRLKVPIHAFFITGKSIRFCTGT